MAIELTTEQLAHIRRESTRARSRSELAHVHIAKLRELGIEVAQWAPAGSLILTEIGGSK